MGDAVTCPTTFGEALGRRLENLREEKELSIDELAERMNATLDPEKGTGSGGIDPSTISDIERGEIETVSMPVLAAFARALGTTVEALEKLNPGEGGEGRFEADPAVDGHDAEQAQDGTWSIKGVPVFSVHVDRRGPEPESYSLKWLEGALQSAQAREAEGYLGPLHVGHHPGDGVEGAGRFRLTGIRDLMYEGSPTPTLFADFVGIPDDQFQGRIKSGELPYRSVEIVGPDRKEILSVALLDDEVPFFRYANMRIRQEHPQKPKRKKRGSYSALVSRTYELGGNKRRVLTFNFAGAEEAPVAETTETPSKTFNLESLRDLLAQSLALVDEALGAAEEGAPPAEETAPVEMAANPTAGQPGVPPELAGKFAALEQQVASLRQQASSDVGVELAELRAAGAPAADLKRFTALAASDGPRAAVAYGRAMVTHYASLPAAPPAALEDVGATDSADPEEVKAYSAQGPEVLEQARRLSTVWARGTKRHALKLYLEAHLEPSNFLPNAKVVNGAK